MTTKQNSVPPEFTGMTTAIGGNNIWSPNGGSRLLLVDATNSNKYKYFNCTQPQIIKFSTNLSALDCGVIAAFYMVAFDQIDSVSGTLYNDAQGIGFVNSSGRALNKQIGRSEIDLLETSGKSAQTTVHGYSSTKPSKGRWHSINIDGSTPYVDQDGIWDNANVDMSSGKFSNDWSNIDTTEPINVVCTITPTPVDTTNTNYYIKVVTEIYQGGSKPKIRLTADSQNPNKSAGQPQKTHFPAVELKNMCFIYSLWTDTDTKWLDGSKDGSYNQRGNCAVSADATKTAKNMFVNFIYDLTWQGIKDTELKNYGWILDYQYRGINSPPKAQPFKGTLYSPVNSNSWAGRYNYSYQNCQVKPTFIPKHLEPNILKSITPTTGGSQDYTICTDKLFPKNTNVMNQYTSDSSGQLKCSYSSAEDSCNVIRTHLVSYDEPSPPPPSSPPPSSPPPSPPPPSSPPPSSPPPSSPPPSSPPPSSPPPSSPPPSSPPPSSPPPSPGPSSKSNNNNKTLAYVSLSMSIVTIILLILMAIMKL